MPSPYPYGPLDMWGPNPRTALVGDSDYRPLRAPVTARDRSLATARRVSARYMPLDLPAPVVACGECGAATVGPLVSDVDGSAAYVCSVHGSVPVGDAVVPLTADAVTPGMRCVDGQWFYSARWL